MTFPLSQSGSVSIYTAVDTAQSTFSSAGWVTLLTCSGVVVPAGAKVVVLAHIGGLYGANGVNTRITRDGAVVSEGAAAGSRTRGNTAVYATLLGSLAMHDHDAPAAGTYDYALQAASVTSAGAASTAGVNRGSTNADNPSWSATTTRLTVIVFP